MEDIKKIEEKIGEIRGLLQRLIGEYDCSIQAHLSFAANMPGIQIETDHFESDLYYRKENIIFQVSKEILHIENNGSFIAYFVFYSDSSKIKIDLEKA